MAVHAAHLAACHLRIEPCQADLPASQLHDPMGLLADMVVLEDARITLATVGASSCGERRDDVADVALLSLRSPRTS